MNLIEAKIEGKVEWCGNGVVVIKERSVMQAVMQVITQMVWQLFVHGEWLLHSMLQRAVRVFKSLLNKSVLFILFKENADEKVLPGRESEQDQMIVPQLVAAKNKKHPSQQMSQPAPQPVPQQKARPMGTLTEIRRYADGQNGLQQLLPALAGFCHDRWLVLVSPPQRPDVAILTAAGIDPSRVLLVHARDTHAFKNNVGNRSGLNVVEQALQSGTCGAVVAWLEACDTPTLQQLRSAAAKGEAWGVMFREAEKESAQLEMGIN